MDQTNTPSTSVSTVATEQTLKDIYSSIQFAMDEIKKIKTGGVQQAMVDMPAAVAVVSKDIADVKAAVPEIKAGLKSTEFWAPVAATAIGIVYYGVTGKDIPVDLTALAASVIGIYIAARTLLKSTVVKQAVVAVPAK